MSRLPSPRVALAILTGLNLLNYVDRYIPAAVLPSLIAGLQLSDAQAGLVQTLFMITYSLVSPVVGILGDRRPRFRMAAIGVLLWSVATFASGLAPTFAVLLVARSLIGVGEASYTVVTPSLLSDFYPAAQRGRVLAIFYAAIPIGTALSYGIGGQIGARLGWRWAFFVAGAPGIALALALLFLRDPERGAMDVAKPATGQRIPISELLKRQSWLLNTIAQTIYTFAMGGLAVWMPTYFVRVRGLRADIATTAFGGVLLAAGFLGTLLGGRFGDRLAARRSDGHFLIAGAALCLSLPFTLLAILSPSPAIFWPSMFVTLTLLFVCTGPLNAAMANVLPAELRARGFAINTFAIHVFGDAASPILIGLVSDRVGLGPPVLATGTLMFVAGLVLLLGRRALARDLGHVT
ncbi:MAG TPA: MFS transporter [Polyangia bacterium]|nr:MFS transporter [Polyangia bacterium]